MEKRKSFSKEDVRLFFFNAVSDIIISDSVNLILEKNKKISIDEGLNEIIKTEFYSFDFRKNEIDLLKKEIQNKLLNNKNK